METKARRLTGDKGAAREVAASVQCPKASRDLISTNLPIVIEQMGIGPENLPACGLAAGLLGWAGGITAALSRLDAMIAEKEAKESKAAAAAAPVPEGAGA